MQVREIMSRNVRTISSGANLVDAAVEMSKSNIGFLAVSEGDCGWCLD